MPLPDANNWSSRIYELLKETDLANLSYSQFQETAEKLFIEPENEDELRRLVLVQLARMAVRGDWDGFLSGGSGGAPTDADYLLAFDQGTVPASLTAARKLVVGNNISMSHGVGANDDMTISATAGGSDGQIQYNVAGVISGTGLLSTNKTNELTIVAISGDGQINISSSSKAVSLLCDENQKLKVKGATDTFILDVSSSSGGITFPDGTTQTTAASSGGNDFNAELVGAALDATGTNYDVFDILSLPPYGCCRYNIGKIDTKQYFYPFIAPKSGDIDDILINITTGASGTTNVYYAVYADNNGVPSTVLGYATANGQTTGVQTLSSFSSTITLSRGTQYWFAENKSTSDTIERRAIDNSYRPRISPFSGFPSTSNSYGTGLTTNSNVSAAPSDTNADNLEPSVFFSALGSCPHVGIRIS